MPPPTLSPPPLHFLIIAFTTTCGINQFVFECETDAPCHLTLHLSIEKPIIRRIPYQKRGADFELSSVTCFVEIQAIDQDQAGDTTTHTFTVPLTAYCTIHYWHLTGTHSGTPSKSTSQIFDLHCMEPTPPAQLCHTVGGETDYADMYNCTEAAGAFQPPAAFKATSIDIRYGTALAYRQCYHGYLTFYTTFVNGKPDTLLYGPYYFTHPPMGDYEWRTHNISLPNLQFNTGARYSIAILWSDTGPGDKYRRMRWCRPSSATCPITPTPSTHFWNRFRDPFSTPPCQGSFSAWAAYYINVYHFHQFYGHLL